MPGPQGFPDYQRFQQGSADILVALTGQPGGASFNLGPFYVGGFQALLVSRLTSINVPSSINLSFNYFNDVALTQPCGSIVCASDNFNVLQDAIPVLGNYVRIHGFTTNNINTYNLSVVPSGTILSGGNGGAGTDVLQTGFSAAVAAGGNAQFFGGIVAGGNATIVAQSTQPGLTVVTTFNAGSGSSPLLLKTVAAPLLGDSWPVQLPRAPITTTITNTAGVAANLSYSLVRAA